MHNVVSIASGCNTFKGGWCAKDSWPITPGRPESIFSSCFRLANISLVLKELGNNFDALLAKKSSFIIKVILCLDAQSGTVEHVLMLGMHG